MTQSLPSFERLRDSDPITRVRDLQSGDRFSFTEFGMVYKVRSNQDGEVRYSRLDEYGHLNNQVHYAGSKSMQRIIIHETGNAQSDGKRPAEGEPGSDS